MRSRVKTANEIVFFVKVPGGSGQEVLSVPAALDDDNDDDGVTIRYSRSGAILAVSHPSLAQTGLMERSMAEGRY